MCHRSISAAVLGGLTEKRRDPSFQLPARLMRPTEIGKMTIMIAAMPRSQIDELTEQAKPLEATCYAHDEQHSGTPRLFLGKTS